METVTEIMLRASFESIDKLKKMLFEATDDEHIKLYRGIIDEQYEFLERVEVGQLKISGKN